MDDERNASIEDLDAAIRLLQDAIDGQMIFRTPEAARASPRREVLERTIAALRRARDSPAEPWTEADGSALAVAALIGELTLRDWYVARTPRPNRRAGSARRCRRSPRKGLIAARSK